MISIVATLFLTLGAEPSHAQTAWRCGGADCTDALLNDIEDRVNQDWVPYSLAMPPIPISCVNRPERCPRCLVDGPSAAANAGAVPSAITHSSVPWSFVLWRSWQSFLFGRYSAGMTVFGVAEASGPSVAHSWWSDTAINYSFAPPPFPGREVPMPGGGSSGVQDLDVVSFTIMSGGLWSGNLSVTVDMHPWAWCDLGYPGGNVRIDGSVTGPRVVNVNYPVAWTPLVAKIGEAIRTQFRSAVVTAVSN